MKVSKNNFTKHLFWSKERIVGNVGQLYRSPGGSQTFAAQNRVPEEANVNVGVIFDITFNIFFPYISHFYILWKFLQIYLQFYNNYFEAQNIFDEI